MRGIVLDARGACWRLRDDLPLPKVGPGDVLVEVRATALNRADLDEQFGAYASDQRRSGRPRVVGSDLAGVVRMVGCEVRGVRVGDRVMAMVEGAFAEYVAVDHRLVVPVPDPVGWSEAAGLPSALMTEYDALVEQGQLGAGQSVLISGAASGVGLVALDIARWLGAAVVLGTTTSAGKEAAVAGRGAQVVSPAAQDLVAAALDSTDGHGVDLAVDHVGGDLVNQLVAATRIGGTVLQVGRVGGRTASVDLDLLAYRRVRLVGTTFRTRGNAQRAHIAEGIRRRLLPAIADGRVRPLVHEVLPWEAAEDAAELLRSGRCAGKVVLVIRGAAIEPIGRSLG